jgi:hypothetical protein
VLPWQPAHYWAPLWPGASLKITPLTHASRLGRRRNQQQQPRNVNVNRKPVTITYLNCYSVRLATGTQNLFTGAKLVAIFIVVVGGVVRIAQGEVKYLASGFEGTKTSFSDIATAFYSEYIA